LIGGITLVPSCRTATQITIVVRTNVALGGHRASLGFTATNGDDYDTALFNTTAEGEWGPDGPTTR